MTSRARFQFSVALCVCATASCFARFSEDRARIGTSDEQSARATTPELTHVTFAADAQLHNVLGGHLKSMRRIPDRMVPVAVRPPELNLLSNMILEDAMRAVRGTSAAVLYLGDGLNIGCASEQSRFRSTLDSALGTNESDATPWFMTHGNHDSFLLGNHNRFTYDGAEASMMRAARRDGVLAQSGIVWSYSHDLASQGHALAYGTSDESEHASWSSACATPTNVAGVPMNKLVWLADYVAHLVDYGLVLEASGGTSDGGSCDERDAGRPLRLSGAIHSVTFSAKGRWVVPFVDACTGQQAEDAWTDTWDSYLAQLVVIPGFARVVLVDTSVGGRELGHDGFLGRHHFAGKLGRVGNAQLDDIRSLATAQSGETSALPLLFAGHFPLEHITDREALVALMHALGAAGYVSAHTHSSSTVGEFGASRVKEWNVGSTTDWPMEVMRMSWASGAGSPKADAFYVGEQRGSCAVSYLAERPRRGRSFQFLVHGPVAETIAQMDLSSWPASGPIVWSAVEPWRGAPDLTRATRLATYVDAIHGRYREEPSFRRFARCLATEASYSECGSARHDAGCVPPARPLPPPPARSSEVVPPESATQDARR